MALRFSPSRGAASLVLNAMVRGPQGTAATLTAGTTTTLAAGASATAANSGTTGAAILDIGIPRGADAGMRYAFEASTSMAAPASGGLRLNHATLSSVTAIAVNATNSDGVDVSSWLATWDDSTNSVKGTIEVRKEGSGAVLGLFTITSVTDNTTWLQFAVTYVSGAGSLSAANPVYLIPYLSGNAGAVSGPGTTVVDEVALFNDTTGNVLKRATGSGLAKLTSGVLSIGAAGTDYAAATSGSAILKGDGSGGFDDAVAGTDYYNPGGTDVAVTDGGTGASTAADALTNLTARGQGKETIWIPAVAMWPRTTNGPGVASRELTTGGDIMIKGWAFDATTEEAVQFYIAFPKSWNKGTITFQAFWTNAAGLTTETVSWGLSAGAFTNDDPIDTTDLGTEVRVSDTWLAQNDLHVTAESSAVTVGNTPIDDDLVIGQIARSVANDDMTGDAELLGIKIFFTTNAATDA